LAGGKEVTDRGSAARAEVQDAEVQQMPSVRPPSRFYEEIQFVSYLLQGIGLIRLDSGSGEGELVAWEMS